MRLWAWLFVLVFMPPPVSHAQQPEDQKLSTVDDWLVGKTRTEVVQLLGKPSKTKVRKAGTVLVYKSDSSGIAFFPSATPNPYAFVAQGETGSGVIDGLLDAVLTDESKQYTELDHAVNVGKTSPIRRIELRLDAENRVETVHVIWRRKAKRLSDQRSE